MLNRRLVPNFSLPVETGHETVRTVPRENPKISFDILHLDNTEIFKRERQTTNQAVVIRLARGACKTDIQFLRQHIRDLAAEAFEHHTGSAWRPRSGSMVNHRNLTAAMIDSRDFLAAKHRAETEVMLPPGPKVALTGGADFNDHHLIWAKLDQVYAKHRDMVLMDEEKDDFIMICVSRARSGKLVIDL